MELDYETNWWQTSELYQQQAMLELSRNFPFLRVLGISRLFHRANVHFYHTMRTIEGITRRAACRFNCGVNKSEGHIAQLTKQDIAELKAKCDKANSGLGVKRLSGVQPQYSFLGVYELPLELQIIDPTLAWEIVWIQAKKRSNPITSSADLFDPDFNYIVNEAEFQPRAEEVSLLECGCCYCEYATEQMCQCTEGHVFCKQCLIKYCEQTVFGLDRSVLRCMNTQGDDCKGFYSETVLQNALPEKVFLKYSLALTRDAIREANLEGLVTCCHCDMQMLVDTDLGTGEY